MKLALVIASFALATFAAVDVRYVPERLDDFVWENEFFGARAYGPGVSQPPPKGEGLVSSGFDAFNKAVPDIMMAETLINGVKNHVSYHKFNGRGFDNYKVSTGRGIGGIGALGEAGWLHDGNWKSQRIIEKSADKAIFELEYEHYTVRGTIETGKAFCRFDVMPKPSWNAGAYGCGLDISKVRNHNGMLKMDMQKGFIANFEPIDPDPANGHVCSAIVLAGGNAILASDPMGCAYLLQLKPAFTYYAGSAWSGAGRFTTPEAWHKYVEDFANSINK